MKLSTCQIANPRYYQKTLKVPLKMLKFVKNMPQTREEIMEYKAEVEADINQLLEDTGSDFTLDDVKEIIYNEEETDDMQKVIAMFDDGDPANLSNAVEVSTDAWNYFPHKLLNGLSPAEISLEAQNKK